MLLTPTTMREPADAKDNPGRLVFVAGGVALGGATTFLLNLGGELVRRGVPVLVVSFEHNNPYAEDFDRARIPLHVEDERRNIFEDRLSSALRVIREFKPTTVISCLDAMSYEVLRYVPKGILRLGMVQSDFPGAYPQIEPYVPFFDGMVAVSREIGTRLRSDPAFRSLPIYYLPYGVAIPREQPQRVRRENEVMRILYIGRLCRPQKRVQLFPEILRQLIAADVRFEWTVAGDGPERNWLEKQMSSNSHGGLVKFTGAVQYQEVPALLDAHDIFLLVSDHEGLPLSLLEAMAHGLVPVVSNLKSGISEVVTAECGILVDPENVAGYAAGISRLAHDLATMASMSEKAAERVRHDYSVQAMTNRWLSLLKVPRESIEWPQEFHVSGPIIESDHWKYTAPGRALRKLARILKIYRGV